MVYSLLDVKYTITNRSLSDTPFHLSNDYTEYFYYPGNLTNVSSLQFSIIKENQTVSATTWNQTNTGQSTTGASSQVQVPRLTISTWSGLAMQCYLITNNLACTLLLPGKYQGNVRGLVFSTTTNNDNQYCSQSKISIELLENSGLENVSFFQMQ